MFWQAMNFKCHLIPILCLALTACSTGFTTVSRIDIPHSPPRTVLILGARSDLPQGEMDQVHNAMRAALQRCGVIAEIFSSDPLTLDTAGEQARFRAVRDKIKPDLIFTYQETQTSAVMTLFNGLILNRNNIAVWKGRFDVVRNDLVRPAAGAYAGGDIVRHLADEGLIGPCPKQG
jgi:hypothetical protein